MSSALSCPVAKRSLDVAPRALAQPCCTQLIELDPLQSAGLGRPSPARAGLCSTRVRHKTPLPLSCPGGASCPFLPCHFPVLQSRSILLVPAQGTAPRQLSERSSGHGLQCREGASPCFCSVLQLCALSLGVRTPHTLG